MGRNVAKAAGWTAGTALALWPLAAPASTVVYDYHIEHPRYGDIGTYSNVVKQTGDDAEIDSELHVAVKLLGIVMFREDAKRVEHWKNNRLVAFTGVTVTNGTRIELAGRAQGDKFVITRQDGTITAPARVHPSNPWAPMVLESDVMMSTRTGDVDKVRVSGGEVDAVTFDGKPFRLHRYEIDGTARNFVWLDDGGVAVAFRTERNGTPIDFVLSHPPKAETSSR